MKKLLTLFALTALVTFGLLVSRVLAAPIGKPKVALYFPITIGDKCVFERRGTVAGGVQIDEFTDSVTGVERKDAGYVVTVRREGPRGFESEFAVKVTEEGVFGRQGKDGTFDRCRLKTSAKKGDNWEVVTKTPDKAPQKVVYVMAGEEDVEVPAGKFKAIRIDSTTEAPDFIAKTSTWYAPNVGMVKMWYNSDDGEVTRSLKSFTPGKK